MKRLKNKFRLGQMKLSFGMIFSIILMILFVAFAFYAIDKFLSMSDAVKIGKFSDSLQSDIDKIWKAPQASQKFEYDLPKKIKKICLIDYSSGNKGGNSDIYEELEHMYYENENLFFYPVGSSEGIDVLVLKHINLEKITETKNPFCIESSKGKVELTLKKNYDEILVRIEK
jgi:hypothetical protein